MFTNAGFEGMDAQKGQPANWRPMNFRTGGQFGVGEDGGKTGQRYVTLKGTEAKNRSAWRQEPFLLWDDKNTAVTVGGWYRTRGWSATPPEYERRW